MAASTSSKSGVGPRYVEIAAELRDQIENTPLAPHTLLASERELAELHGVSRMTARQAITVLEYEGYVYRRPPRGTFVAEPRVVFRVGSFTAEVLRAGRTPGAEIISAKVMRPTALVRKALSLQPSDQVHALRRLRFADDEPLAVETTFLPVRLTPCLLDEELTGSLWALLRDRHGIVSARSDATLHLVVLDEATTTLLRMRSAAPGILQVRTTYDSSGHPIEYARDIYRADRTAFRFDATVHPPD
jgi:GntR family transcriptional regulator